MRNYCIVFKAHLIFQLYDNHATFTKFLTYSICCLYRIFFSWFQRAFASHSHWPQLTRVINASKKYQSFFLFFRFYSARVICGIFFIFNIFYVVCRHVHVAPFRSRNILGNLRSISRTAYPLPILTTIHVVDHQIECEHNTS